MCVCVCFKTWKCSLHYLLFDIGTQVCSQKVNKGHKNFPRKIIKKKNPLFLLYYTAGLWGMPAKKIGITQGDGKTGPFPLWVVAEFLLAVIVKYVTRHLCWIFSSAFLQTMPLLSHKNTKTWRLWRARFWLGSSLFKSCVTYAERGKDMGNGRGGKWEKGRNVSPLGALEEKRAFQNCCRYLMKTQAATMVRAKTGTRTIAVGIPLGSPSPRCPIGPFCTCNLCCTLRDTA